jgi:hypothetical protein
LLTQSWLSLQSGDATLARTARTFPMDETSTSAVLTAIRSYLAARPESADTLEGIHQWWINWPGLPESMAVTAAALDQLEAAGVVERLQVGNRELWRRRRPSNATPG